MLDDLCLAKFAIAYEPVIKTGATHDDPAFLYNDDDEASHEDDGLGPNSPNKNVITLKGGLGEMQKWKREAILRVKNFKVTVEPENFYHSCLILYLPWWSEDDLLGNYLTYKDHYLEVSNIIEHNAANFNLHSDVMDAAVDHIADNG